MEFSTFLSKIPKIKKQSLGGLTSQLKMTPVQRIKINLETIKSKNPKESAVLALFFPNANNETCFLLTKRASYKGTHSAQISFPGGKKDKSDNSLKATALRETSEEVGIQKNNIEIIRKLTKTYIPPSNFWVTPYIGISNKIPSFTTNYEVEELIIVKLSDLLDDKNLTKKTLSTSYMKNIQIPCFLLNNNIVWGATAMILSEIKDLFYLLLKD